jgi:hypothetical protein
LAYFDRYIGADRKMRDGKEVTIDRYAVPQRHVQQVVRPFFFE